MIYFPNVTFDAPSEYKEFILSHEDAVKTEKHGWEKAIEAGLSVIPYCNSSPHDDNRDDIVYFEFVDSDFNIYVEFYSMDTKEWIESYKFKDDDMAWTISVDNWLYGNPLNLKTEAD